MAVETLVSSTCRRCGSPLHRGFARCQKPACRVLREEFEGYASVVVDHVATCIFSGASTDVELPNGDGLWPEYFLGMIRDGLIGPDLAYTDAFYEKYPQADR